MTTNNRQPSNSNFTQSKYPRKKGTKLSKFLRNLMVRTYVPKVVALQLSLPDTDSRLTETLIQRWNLL